MIRAVWIDTEPFCSTLLEELSLVQPVQRLQLLTGKRHVGDHNDTNPFSEPAAQWEPVDQLQRHPLPDYDAQTGTTGYHDRDHLWARFFQPADCQDHAFSTLVLTWLDLLQTTLYKVLQRWRQTVAEAKGALEAFVSGQENVVYQGNAEILQSKRLNTQQTNCASLRENRNAHSPPPCYYPGAMAEVLIRYCDDDAGLSGSAGPFKVGNIGLLSFEDRENVDGLGLPMGTSPEKGQQTAFFACHLKRPTAFAYVAKLSTVNTYEGSRATVRLRLFLPDAEAHHKKNGRHTDLLMRVLQARVASLPVRFTFVKTGNLASAVRLQRACKQLVNREKPQSFPALAYHSENFGLCEALPKEATVPFAFTPLLGFPSNAGRKIRGLAPSVLRRLTEGLNLCDEQHAVILECCGIDSSVYTDTIPQLILVDGEAGTGKSHTIAGLIAAAHTAERRILVVTPSVSALEHLLLLTHVVLFENSRRETEAQGMETSDQEEKLGDLPRLVPNAIGTYTTRGSLNTVAYTSPLLDTGEGTVMDLYDIIVREKRILEAISLFTDTPQIRKGGNQPRSPSPDWLLRLETVVECLQANGPRFEADALPSWNTQLKRDAHTFQDLSDRLANLLETFYMSHEGTLPLADPDISHDWCELSMRAGSCVEEWTQRTTLPGFVEFSISRLRQLLLLSSPIIFTTWDILVSPIITAWTEQGGFLLIADDTAHVPFPDSLLDLPKTLEQLVVVGKCQNVKTSKNWFYRPLGQSEADRVVCESIPSRTLEPFTLYSHCVALAKAQRIPQYTLKTGWRHAKISDVRWAQRCLSSVPFYFAQKVGGSRIETEQTLRICSLKRSEERQPWLTVWLSLKQIEASESVLPRLKIQALEAVVDELRRSSQKFPLRSETASVSATSESKGTPFYPFAVHHVFRPIGVVVRTEHERRQLCEAMKPSCLWIGTLKDALFQEFSHVIWFSLFDTVLEKEFASSMSPDLFSESLQKIDNFCKALCTLIHQARSGLHWITFGPTAEGTEALTAILEAVKLGFSSQIERDHIEERVPQPVDLLQIREISIELTTYENADLPPLVFVAEPLLQKRYALEIVSALANIEEFLKTSAGPPFFSLEALLGARNPEDSSLATMLEHGATPGEMECGNLSIRWIRPFTLFRTRNGDCAVVLSRPVLEPCGIRDRPRWTHTVIWGSTNYTEILKIFWDIRRIRLVPESRFVGLLYNARKIYVKSRSFQEERDMVQKILPFIAYRLHDFDQEQDTLPVLSLKLSFDMMPEKSESVRGNCDIIQTLLLGDAKDCFGIYEKGMVYSYDNEKNVTWTSFLELFWPRLRSYAQRLYLKPARESGFRLVQGSLLAFVTPSAGTKRYFSKLETVVAQLLWNVIQSGIYHIGLFLLLLLRLRAAANHPSFSTLKVQTFKYLSTYNDVMSRRFCAHTLGEEDDAPCASACLQAQELVLVVEFLKNSISLEEAFDSSPTCINVAPLRSIFTMRGFTFPATFSSSSVDENDGDKSPGASDNSISFDEQSVASVNEEGQSPEVWPFESLMLLHHLFSVFIGMTRENCLLVGQLLEAYTAEKARLKMEDENDLWITLCMNLIHGNDQTSSTQEHPARPFLRHTNQPANVGSNGNAPLPFNMDIGSFPALCYHLAAAGLTGPTATDSMSDNITEITILRTTAFCKAWNPLWSLLAAAKAHNGPLNRLLPLLAFCFAPKHAPQRRVRILPLSSNETTEQYPRHQWILFLHALELLLLDRSLPVIFPLQNAALGLRTTPSFPVELRVLKTTPLQAFLSQVLGTGACSRSQPQGFYKSVEPVEQENPEREHRHIGLVFSDNKLGYAALRKRVFQLWEDSVQRQLDTLNPLDITLIHIVRNLNSSTQGVPRAEQSGSEYGNFKFQEISVSTPEALYQNWHSTAGGKPFDEIHTYDLLSNSYLQEARSTLGAANNRDPLDATYCRAYPSLLELQDSPTKGIQALFWGVLLEWANRLPTTLFWGNQAWPSTEQTLGDGTLYRFVVAENLTWIRFLSTMCVGTLHISESNEDIMQAYIHLFHHGLKLGALLANHTRQSDNRTNDAEATAEQVQKLQEEFLCTSPTDVYDLSVFKELDSPVLQSKQFHPLAPPNTPSDEVDTLVRLLAWSCGILQPRCYQGKSLKEAHGFFPIDLGCTATDASATSTTLSSSKNQKKLMTPFLESPRLGFCHPGTEVANDCTLITDWESTVQGDSRPKVLRLQPSCHLMKVTEKTISYIAKDAAETPRLPQKCNISRETKTVREPARKIQDRDRREESVFPIMEVPSGSQKISKSQRVDYEFSPRPCEQHKSSKNAFGRRRSSGRAKINSQKTEEKKKPSPVIVRRRSSISNRSSSSQREDYGIDKPGRHSIHHSVRRQRHQHSRGLSRTNKLSQKESQQHHERKRRSESPAVSRDSALEQHEISSCASGEKGESRKKTDISFKDALFTERSRHISRRKRDEHFPSLQTALRGLHKILTGRCQLESKPASSSHIRYPQRHCHHQDPSDDDLSSYEQNADRIFNLYGIKQCPPHDTSASKYNDTSQTRTSPESEAFDVAVLLKALELSRRSQCHPYHRHRHHLHHRRHHNHHHRYHNHHHHHGRRRRWSGKRRTSRSESSSSSVIMYEPEKHGTLRGRHDRTHRSPGTLSSTFTCPEKDHNGVKNRKNHYPMEHRVHQKSENRAREQCRATGNRNNRPLPPVACPDSPRYKSQRGELTNARDCRPSQITDNSELSSADREYNHSYSECSDVDRYEKGFESVETDYYPDGFNRGYRRCTPIPKQSVEGFVELNVQTNSRYNSKANRVPETLMRHNYHDRPPGGVAHRQPPIGYKSTEREQKTDTRTSEETWWTSEAHPSLCTAAITATNPAGVFQGLRKEKPFQDFRCQEKHIGDWRRGSLNSVRQEPISAFSSHSSHTATRLKREPTYKLKETDASWSPINSLYDASEMSSSHRKTRVSPPPLERHAVYAVKHPGNRSLRHVHEAPSSEHGSPVNRNSSSHEAQRRYIEHANSWAAERSMECQRYRTELI